MPSEIIAYITYIQLIFFQLIFHSTSQINILSKNTNIILG